MCVYVCMYLSLYCFIYISVYHLAIFLSSYHYFYLHSSIHPALFHDFPLMCPFVLFFSLCVCMVYAHVSIRMHVCMCRSEVNIRCLLLSLFKTLFGTRSSSIWPDKLERKSLGSLYPYSKTLRFTKEDCFWEKGGHGSHMSTMFQ